MEIDSKPYACEVIIKLLENKQGFYLHEVGLTKGLTDLFTTGSILSSIGKPVSRLILAGKILESKGDLKKRYS